MLPRVGRVCSFDINSVRSSALKHQVSTTWLPCVLMILIACPSVRRTARPRRAGSVWMTPAVMGPLSSFGPASALSARGLAVRCGQDLVMSVGRRAARSIDRRDVLRAGREGDDAVARGAQHDAVARLRQG